MMDRLARSFLAQGATWFGAEKAREGSKLKVFLSHQTADTALAARLAHRLLTVHQMASYLDVIDPGIKTGEDLAGHVRSELGKCTQLLAVVSPATQASWWVPWEIGVAAEKDYPLATYGGGDAELPEYLRKWPYLRSDADLDRYAQASKAASAEISRSRTANLNESVSRVRGAREFYRVLRASLRQ